MSANYFISIFILITVSTFITSCNQMSDREEKIPADIVKNPRSATGDDESEKIPAIYFENKTHDFGKVIQGEKVSYYFKFRNIGKADMIISDVSSSCGCTVPEFTNDPVEPGEEGRIKVTFDSNNRRGFQNKTVSVVSNTNPNVTVLRIKAQVIVPERF